MTHSSPTRRFSYLPDTRYRPTLWRYADMRAMCLRAIDLVKPEEAGRRVVTLLNDSDEGRANVAVCGWLFSGMQAMRPGEITPAHKHTASAHRFIMEGKDRKSTRLDSSH